MRSGHADRPPAPPAAITWAAILVVGLGAGTLSAIVGFGASTMLMPALMRAFGPQRAVPIMAVAGLLANASRLMVWWREVDWRANLFYCTTAAPSAALGARTLLMVDGAIIEAVLGLLFLVMIPARRWLSGRGLRIAAWQLSLVGAGIGFLSGMVASTGPINAPFFLAHGLVKGAYLATEALGSMAIGISKAIVFQRFAALSSETLAQGLAVGASPMIGSRLAKGFVLRLPADHFRHIMDCLLAAAGVILPWGALVSA